jgi:uncharacterized protein YjbJ (UPF0337 family)
MKSEQVEGVAEKIAGKAQGAFGKLIGDEGMRAEGAGREASGQLTQTYGDAVDGVTSFVKSNPVAALAIGAGLGLIISRLLRN